MRILLVKTSSLGDVIHNLPVASDIARRQPGAIIDWCVEDSFAAIPALHPAVGRVIPVAVRRWRKHPLSPATWRALKRFRADLRAGEYDRVVDSQGLIKSGLVSRWARGHRVGYDRESIREPLAVRFYDATVAVARAQHAVERNRQLAAAALGYELTGLPLDYGLALPPLCAAWLPSGAYAMCFTATSRDDKLWPEDDWRQLLDALNRRGLMAVLPAGTAVEGERARRIAAGAANAIVPPPLGLGDLAALIAGASLAVGVDTGLTHLAAALRIPTLALYLASEPGLTGVLGCAEYFNLGARGTAPTVGDVLASVDLALR
jgi:heptosyltransferase-1